MFHSDKSLAEAAKRYQPCCGDIPHSQGWGHLDLHPPPYPE